MIYFQYLRELLSVFFKGWWSAVSVVVSLGTAIALPSEGVNVGRFWITLLMLLFFILVYMVLAVVSVSWKWYAQSGVHPSLLEFLPEQAGQTPMIFLIDSHGLPLPPGSVLAVFRMMHHGAEVCAAILEVGVERTDGSGYQAKPKWIGEMHRTSFQKLEVRTKDLKLRVINAAPLEVVEACLVERQK